MTVVATVQARTGSTRLPGKVMYPLAGVPVVRRVAERASRARTVDRVVVATTDAGRDDVIEREADRLGIECFRGDERDVLGRTVAAAAGVDAETVVRIAGDCPFVAPAVVDATVERLGATGADYASNKLERSFPLGLDVEAVTMASLTTVADVTTGEADREHVTTYYRNYPEAFALENLPSRAVFAEPRFRNRTDLRLVLDEAPDYALAARVYAALGDDPRVEDIIDHVDTAGLNELNAHLDRPTGGKNTPVTTDEIDSAGTDSRDHTGTNGPNE